MHLRHTSSPVVRLHSCHTRARARAHAHSHTHTHIHAHTVTRPQVKQRYASDTAVLEEQIRSLMVQRGQQSHSGDEELGAVGAASKISGELSRHSR